jgi:hypothetical protein
MDPERENYVDLDLKPQNRLASKLYRAFRAWLIICSVIVGSIGLIIYLLIPTDNSDRARGSPEYAAHWRTVFNGYSDPDSAKAAQPEIVSKRFANGEWAFAIDRDSHAFRDGGTVVIKDSKGRVRAFFGHVCGAVIDRILRNADSLDGVYKSDEWRIYGFAEYTFPN